MIKGHFGDSERHWSDGRCWRPLGQIWNDAMYVANFKLKNSVKSLLYKLQFVRDFFILHPLREMQRLALPDSLAYIRENTPPAAGLVNEREVFNIALARMPAELLLLEFGVHKTGT